jgi:hypothetical protein
LRTCRLPAAYVFFYYSNVVFSSSAFMFLQDAMTLLMILYSVQASSLI